MQTLHRMLLVPLIALGLCFWSGASGGQIPQPSQDTLPKCSLTHTSTATGYHTLGFLYSKREALEEAIAAFNKALEFDPCYIPAHRALADIYQRQGRSEEAKKHLDLIKELQK